MTRDRAQERLRRYNKGVCRDCANPRLHDKRYCADCLTNNKARLTDLENQRRVMNSRQILKDRVFEAYGGYVCACCGETEITFLTIDHIDGSGREHRGKVLGNRSTGGDRFYRWLKKNDFPPGFQVLCRNCNWGKHIYGKCPHKSS